MLRRKTFVLILALLSVSTVYSLLFAQKATVKATIQPIEINIGQQSVISLEVIAPKGHSIIFPVYQDSLVSGIEVLNMPKADTVIAHDVMTITQKYIITSFDSALYHVPFMPVIDVSDTIQSNSFGLKVISPLLTDASLSYLDHLKAEPNDSIDLDKLGLFDIKSVQEPPFVWQDYLFHTLLILFALLILAGIVFAIYMYRKKKDKGYFFKPEIIEPPHIIALNALNHIKEEKLWQKGQEKKYYTELTDILRKYIEDRFHINAFEKTSDEIVVMIRHYIESDSSLDSLKQVLKLSDLVKFAKFKPLPDENDLSLVNSILFVNQTKREENELNSDIVEHKINSTNNDVNNKDDESIDWTIPEEDKIK